MPRLTVIHEDGSETPIEGAAGTSLMALMRDNDIDEILAQCGGCCSCATCHVWFDPEVFESLPPMGAQEDDLLDMAEVRYPTSRLSCQIPMTEALDGIRVHVVAP